LEGLISFKVHVFGVTSIKEAVNYLVYRQFRCNQQSINEAVKSVLYPRYGRDTNSILEDTNLEDRKLILAESGFDFESLPGAFRNGIIIYITAKLVDTIHSNIVR